MIKLYRIKYCIVISVLIFFISNSSLAQVDSNFYNKLEEVDEKIDNWQHKEVKQILKELEKKIDTLNTVERFALELRRFKVEYYVDDNDSNFGVALSRVDELITMNAPELEYDYLSFIGEVYKISFNFETAFSYHRKALLNAENRKDTIDIIFSCWSLGNSYYVIEYNDPKFYDNKLDSSLYFYNKALTFPENEKTDKYFQRIYNNLGRIETVKKNFDKAKNHINKALYLGQKGKDSFGISISYNNLSKIYLLEKKYNEAITIAQKSNEYIKDKSLRIRRNNLENIANAYQGLGKLDLAYDNMKNTLETSEELNNQIFVNNVNKIEKKYQLAKEQQKTLQEKNKRLKTQFLLYIFISLVIISTIIGFIFYSKNQRNKKLFKELISKTQRTAKTIEHNKAQKIPKKIVDKIVTGIELFEKTQGFISKDITLNQLATQLETNPKYLSHIINSYKKKNFSLYLSDLRIDYIIEKLQTNKQLQKYTIEAISDSVGFGNTVSFSTAFRKKTGLNPSYFIKQLKKKDLF